MRDLERRLHAATDLDGVKSVLEDMLMEIRTLEEQIAKIKPECLNCEDY